MPQSPPSAGTQGCRDQAGLSQGSQKSSQATGLSSQISCLSPRRCPSLAVAWRGKPPADPGLPPLHPLPPPGLAPRPVPGGGTGAGAGGERQRAARREQVPERQRRRTHGTRPLPFSPVPAARLRPAAPGLDVRVGVFWGTDASCPESPPMTLISFVTSSTHSLGPSASPLEVGMLAFLLAGCASHLPVTSEYFPITRRCLTGSSRPISL